MSVSTYKRNVAQLATGINFARNGLIVLEKRVVTQLIDAVTFYQADGNIDHVKYGMFMLADFNPRWAAPFGKAMKDIRGLHTTFKMVTKPCEDNSSLIDIATWTYEPIAKDKRPSELPTLEAVVIAMLASLNEGKRSRDPKTEAEKVTAWDKATVTRVTSDKFPHALRGFEAGDLAELAARVSAEQDRRSAGRTEPAMHDEGALDTAPAPVKATVTPINPDRLVELVERFGTTG